MKRIQTMCMILLTIIFTASVNNLNVLYSSPMVTSNASFSVKDYNANSTFVPLRRIFVISSNKSSYIDEFAFLAALPLSVFHHENSVYVSPILFSDLTIAEENLLRDWASYVKRHSNVSYIVSIGSLSLDDEKRLHQIVEAPIYPSFPLSDLCALSADLASLDWKNSTIAVLTPVPENLSIFQANVIKDTWKINFKDADVRSESWSINIQEGEKQTIKFQTFGNESWIEGYIEGLSTSIITSHYLLDPLDFNVSYSRYSWVGYLVSESGTTSDFFIVPNANNGTYALNVIGEHVDGIKPLNISLKFHTGIRRTLSVPNDVIWLNLTLDWDDYNEDLDLVAISPDGMVASWSISDNKEKGSASEKLSVYCPTPGDWTILVGWWNGVGSLNATLSYSLTIRSSNVEKYLETALNAAVLSSKLNAPLLYTLTDDVPSNILETLLELSVSKVILTDPYRKVSSNVVQKLTAAGIAVEVLNSKEDLYSKIVEDDSSGVVVTIPDMRYFPASALIAAYHKMPVVILPRSLITMVEASWVPFIPEYGQYEGTTLDDMVPHFYMMKKLSDRFFDFLSGYGLNNNAIIVVSPLTLLKPTFDRAIIGKSIVGRIIGNSEEETVAFALRNLLYPALIYSNFNRDKALLSFFAYTYGVPFQDNYGILRKVYEKRYINDSLASHDYNITFQVGYNDVLSILNDGVGIWVLSTHGNVIYGKEGRLYGIGVVTLSNVRVKWGTENGDENNPDANGDKIVDPPSTYSISIYDYNLDANLGDLGSTLVVISGCLVGASRIPNVLLKHGVAFILAPVRTVYFESAGWFITRFFQEATNNVTLGEALRRGIKDTSDVYSESFLSQSDWSLVYILFGDPLASLYSNSWKEPLPAETGKVIADGHIPGYGLHEIAVISLNGYLMDDLNKIYSVGSFKIFNISEISIDDIFERIYLFKAIIFESGTLNILSDDLEAYKSVLESYIKDGGIVIVLGVESQSLEWLPLKIESSVSKHGSTIRLSSIYHPLLVTPNTLNENMKYYGIFVTFDPRYFILATNEEGRPVWLAASYYFGKVTVLTMKPDINNNTALIQNLIAWRTVLPLFIEDAHLSNSLVLEGKKVTLSLKLTDRYLREISDADVKIYIGSKTIEAASMSNGSYTATIDTSDLGGNIQIIVKAFREGYDPVSAVLTLRVITYIHLALTFTVLILFIVVIFVLRKRKRKRNLTTKIELTRKTTTETKPKYEAHVYVCPFCQSRLNGPYAYCPYCGSYTGFKEK
nr:hypothetical protein [Candidatus Baldrarchaeota archaeon]